MTIACYYFETQKLRFLPYSSFLLRIESKSTSLSTEKIEAINGVYIQSISCHFNSSIDCICKKSMDYENSYFQFQYAVSLSIIVFDD